ncbi:linear amide C-N hydrolase [Candidatus Omnitrophota bacterium]
MKKIISICIASIMIFSSAEAYPCSRVLWAPEEQPSITGRNMDWPVPMGTKLRIMPRGAKRSGLTDNNALEWTSKYGSVVATVWDEVVCDGMNEKGLDANILYLTGSEYGQRDTTRPGLAISQWAQYYLDNFETVAEAVKVTKEIDFQILPVYLMDKGEKVEAPLHLSLSDATGDSAIIEILAGKTVIHHGKEYTVMTNSPTYDEQLVLLKQYEGLGGTKPIPGTSEPEDRFARAAYYLKLLPPKPDNFREAVAGVLSVMRNAATPIGVLDPKRPNISMTQWTSIADSTDRIYYFEFTRLPNVVWAKLDEFDLNAGAPEMVLDILANPTLSGDVSTDFKEASPLTTSPAGQVGGAKS